MAWHVLWTRPRWDCQDYSRLVHSIYLSLGVDVGVVLRMHPDPPSLLRSDANLLSV